MPSPKPKAWRTPKRSQKEIGKAGVRLKCVGWARRRGWWVRKFSSPGNRSVPDDLFAKKIGGVSFKLAVEFKAPKKTSSDLQQEEQQAMRDAGWDVYVIDSLEKFVALFEPIEQQLKQTPEDWLGGD